MFTLLIGSHHHPADSLIQHYMNIKPFKASLPDLSGIGPADTFCEEAKTEYNTYLSRGLYKKTTEKALFVYQIASKTRQHTGLVAINDMDDFSVGKVKKHENTLTEREEHQIDLIMRWEALLKPVLLTYPATPELDQWLETYIKEEPPFFQADFKKDSQTHRIWKIAEPANIEALQHIFTKKINQVYIADGHHRTTTIALLRDRHSGDQRFEFDALFCVFFGANQLDILDYNRVVSIDFESPESWMTALSAIFTIKPLTQKQKPVSKFELVMLFSQKWYSLIWKPEVLDAERGTVILDANLLNTHILQNLIGIKDVRTDKRVMYVEGSKGFEGLKKAVEAAPNRVGFMLYPVAFDDMTALADKGESLPPKSTYFEPRLKSGILVKSILRND